MNNPKNNPAKPAIEFRETLEEGASQARDNYKKIGAAATEGADVLKTSYSTAIKSVQDYNTKLLEFAHANAQAAFGFFQKLSDVKSPTAFVELSTEHARKQFETLSDWLNERTAGP